MKIKYDAFVKDIPTLSISIVLPAHNEEENIGPQVDDVANAMKKLDWDYEIVVVDDGSTDKTAQILADKKASNERIRVVTLSPNKGYGGAVRSGFNATSKEWIFFTDSDRQFDIREITKLAEYVTEFDMVIGYRAKRSDHWVRLLNAWLFKMAVTILFGLWVKDIDCAFKLIKRKIIFQADLRSDGALINTELLVKAKRAGYKWKQIPVSHYPRTTGSPSGANIKVILRAMKELLQFRFTGRIGK